MMPTSFGDVAATLPLLAFSPLVDNRMLRVAAPRLNSTWAYIPTLGCKGCPASRGQDPVHLVQQVHYIWAADACGLADSAQ